MIKIGEYNNLKALKTTNFGIYLDGKQYGEILLPKKFIPQNTKINDYINVFVYFDSEDRIIATTQKAKAQVNEFAFLKVIAINEKIGAFLDWGLDKDLLIPKTEQQSQLELNKNYISYVYIDKQTNRIAASTKIEKYFNKNIKFTKNEKVELLIYKKTELGFKAIINNKTYGLIYENEIFTILNIGDRIDGFIKNIREDSKIDLSINNNENIIQNNATKILNYIQNNKHDLSDNTDPKIIYSEFGISKKAFKNSIGYLYKNKKINIINKKISLN